MYLECIICPKLGISCDGPNFVAMSASELLEWCKQRKKVLGSSNAKLAEDSGVPKGTIDRLFAGEHIDFKYETIRPLLKVLVGGSYDGNPCPDPNGDEDNENLREIIAKQEESINRLRTDKKDMLDIMASNRNNISFLQDQIQVRNKVIIVLSVLLGVVLAVNVGLMII